MKLTPKLAQPFVRMMEGSLPYRVTITDADGYIVGSSNTSRLGQFHPSAYEILCGRMPIEATDPDSYLELPESVILGYGEKIIYDGECIGIIGLIGPPEERKQDIKTAQFILHLLLDRERAQAELELIASDKNSFFVRLLHSTSQTEIWLKKRAAIYNFSLELPRHIALVQVQASDLKDHQPLEAARIRKNVLNEVKTAFPHTEDCIFEVETGEIVVLTTSGGSKRAARWEEHLNSVLRELYRNIHLHCNILPLIAVSPECESYLSYPTAYQQALSALEIGRHIAPEQGIFQYEKIRLGRIVSELTEEARQILREGIIEPLSRTQGTDLLETLQIYFAQNASASATADALFIHRNTLQYRFKQILDLTGYDIRNMDDRIQLRLAVLLYLLSRDQE